MYSKKSLAIVALYALGMGVNAAPSNVGRRDTAIPGLSQLGVSSGCQSTLESLISSPAAACLNLPGTLAIFSTVANSSWIPATNTWLSNFCCADPCTSDALNSTLSIAADGCSAELATFGVTTDEIIQEATTYFPIAKEAVCLRDSSQSNGLCAITTLNALQTALGGQPLTPAVVEANYYLLLENNYALAKQLACTPCSSAAFALIQPALPQQFVTMIDSFVGDQCGANFTSTATSSITVVTGTAAVLAASATASTSASAHVEAHGLFVGAMAIFSLMMSLF